MPFSERLKAKIRKSSHFRCCLCKAIGVEIHHIIPEEEGGLNTQDNAAPLCPSCHETYGANRSKRKFIREARDCWFEICENRYLTDEHILSEIRAIAEKVPSKKDLESLKSDLLSTIVPEMRKAGYLLSNDEATSTQRRSEYSSLDDIIVFLYKTNYEEAGVRAKDSAFLFEFLFGDDLGDEGIEELKREFTFRFGAECAKKLCSHVLLESSMDFDKGFTVEEMRFLVGMVRTVMVAMLCHEDIVEHGPIILAKICDDNQLRFSTGPCKD